MTNNRTAAARYARALLQVASRDADPDQVERELGEFITFLSGQPEVARALLSRAVSPPRKRAAVTALAARGGLSPIVSRLLALLAERDQVGMLGDLLAAYRERLLERRQIVSAEVTTAGPLPRDRAEAIERRLSAITGKRVSMTTRVDPRIIGGVVARVGSTVYDGSVATHLKRVRRRLVETDRPAH
jgi:F-type H+-transporting ATPase subunit delta